MIKPVTMYSVVCDRCGKTFEADDSIAWTDKQSVRFYALESEWVEIGDNHYCPDCYEFNDELDEFVPKRKEVKKMKKYELGEQIMLEVKEYDNNCDDCFF